MRGDDRASARNERVFAQAQGAFRKEIQAIFARHSLAGRLQSGATVRVIVNATDEPTVAALNELLEGIGAVTEHQGTKRKRFLEQLQGDLGNHHAAVRDIAREAIERAGLGRNYEQAVPLLEALEEKHRAAISDFSEGWTAPAGKQWKDRHPILFALVIAFVSAVFGAAAKTALDQYFSNPSAQVAPVAPDVAPAKKLAPAPVKNQI